MTTHASARPAHLSPGEYWCTSRGYSGVLIIGEPTSYRAAEAACEYWTTTSQILQRHLTGSPFRFEVCVLSPDLSDSIVIVKSSVCVSWDAEEVK